MLLVAPQTTSCNEILNLYSIAMNHILILMEMGRATVTPECQRIVNIQKTCFHTDQKMCHIKIQSLLSSTAVTTLE